ncbi:hypothetical protein [Flagellimonas eckloniae]|uniref:Viral A-type inclusion protein n=1 Tax=Flagellimonas eckloniae TaxID=346185 RepID=A0A0Q0WZS2_9FLAO|nr:hypothetical protein [Allomuricauda eckloniae]KQC30902.1 hypothetical protein AAY42_14140 [Allomuricauda eckloniae]
MKTVASFLICTLIFISFSCKQEKKASDGPTQMEQVMAVHDEVMPKMGTLGKLVGELKSKVDTTEMGQQYEVAMKDLQAANKSMMDWMMGFGDRFDSDEILDGKELTEEKQKWLDEEEVKVNALKEQINSSIEKAELLLAKE